jgi:hypothetical protein
MINVTCFLIEGLTIVLVMDCKNGKSSKIKSFKYHKIPPTTLLVFVFQHVWSSVLHIAPYYIIVGVQSKLYPPQSLKKILYLHI